MINQGDTKTKFSPQEMQNKSFDKDFNIGARELLGYDSDADALVRLKVSSSGAVIIDPTNLDTRYLKLDSSNSPLIGPNSTTFT